VDSHDWLTLVGPLLSTIFVMGTMWGVTRQQTAALKESIGELREALRHHLQTEHPRFDAAAREAERELAVLRARTDSQIAHEERTRR
jgi:hypothetical protein